MKKEWSKLLEVNQIIYIYGAGKIGKKVLSLIKQNNQIDKVKGFIVSDKTGNPDYIETIKVIQIDELVDKDALILLSVTDVYQEEILNLLRIYGCENIIDAYKFSFININDHTDEVPDTIFIDTRELLVQQYSNGKFNRLDIIVRLLAVENYYHLNEYGFELYKKMQEMRIRAGYSDVSIKRFKGLIKSFEQNGYDCTTEIIVDSNLKLIDGSHRLALAIYYNIPKVKIMIDKESRNIDYGIEWFKHYFLKNECKIIKNKLNDVSINWVRPIKGIIWPNAIEFKDEITDYIDSKYHILRFKDYRFPQEIFTRFVKGVYHIDDIAEWKINNKLKHFCSKGIYQIRVMDIDIKYPDFRIKSTGKTLSKAGEKLKQEVRNEFKNRIDNYYYDIVFHSADNYHQSQYLDALLPNMFSIQPFFKSISAYNWMLIKTENDYFPEDFPKSFALYKDVDIITTIEDAEGIKQNAIDFLRNYQNGIYDIKVINRKMGYLIRFEIENFLILQIDISFSNKFLNENFIINSLSNKIEKNDYYISSSKDECVYRFVDFIENPYKKKHWEYILSYFEK